MSMFIAPCVLHVAAAIPLPVNGCSATLNAGRIFLAHLQNSAVVAQPFEHVTAIATYIHDY